MSALDGYRKVLAISPHADDAVLGAGATLARLAEDRSREIWCVVLCDTSDELKRETWTAMRCLGILRDRVIFFEFRLRLFSSYRQTLLDTLIGLREEINPDLIFTPSLHDLHQDHGVTTGEALRVWKQRTVLGYEEPWNNLTFSSTCLVPVQGSHVAMKLDAVDSFRSQSHRPYVDEAFIRGLVRVRGVQVGRGFAEAFEVLRWVV